MIAKGHDIDGVTLAGVVGGDHSLSMPDFRAAEREFQLRPRSVAGPGAVVARSCRCPRYYPDHYAILAASTHDYASSVEPN